MTQKAGDLLTPEINNNVRKSTLIEDLGGSVLFVQLLSNVAGKRPAGIEQGYNYLQYDQVLNI